MDLTLGLMVKAKLYRQNLTQKHTQIHSQKKGKGEKLIYPAPKVHLLNLGGSIVYSGIQQMQALQVVCGALIRCF